MTKAEYELILCLKVDVRGTRQVDDAEGKDLILILDNHHLRRSCSKNTGFKVTGRKKPELEFLNVMPSPGVLESKDISLNCLSSLDGSILRWQVSNLGSILRNTTSNDKI